MTVSTFVVGGSSSILDAYRIDASQRRGDPAFGRDDAAWLTLGTIVARATCTAGESRNALLEHARQQLHATLGEASWAQGPALDPQPPRDPHDMAPRIRLLCEQIEDAGALHLADAILSTYRRADDALSPLEAGRVEALRGRLAWKRGDHDAARDHYHRVDLMGRKSGSPELRVRALVGQAVLARIRGNYPASRQAARRAVALGQANGLTRLAALGHQCLMIAAVVANELNTALRHSWLAYQDVRGDATAEAAGLVDMAQLFLIAGHVPVAASGFAAALRQTRADRVTLPALGGAALAAARGGDAAQVVRIADDLRTRVDETALSYLMANCQLDVAEALYLIDDTDAAEWFRDSAATVADRYGYHELTYRADALRASAAPLPETIALTEESQEIGAAVLELAGAER